MRRLHVVSIHCELIEAYKRFGVLRSAHEKNIASVTSVALRDFAVDKHGSVDDRPYGGGESMVMRPEPLAAAIRSIGGEAREAAADRPIVISTSPAGRAWSHSEALRWSADSRDLTFVCGRFAGVDQRFLDRYVDHEYSLGDFVLAGGELAVLAMIESILRLVPGVLGDDESATSDSFAAGMDGLLEHPLYTRPPVFEGESVPEVLLSGDHAKIAAWRRQEAKVRTAARRPDLLARKP